MYKKKESCRVAAYFCGELDTCPSQEIIQAIMNFCEFKHYEVILLAMEETPEGAIGRKGYLTLSELLKKDMIDGIITLTGNMFFSGEGELLLSEILKDDFFFIPYIEEMERRKEEMVIKQQAGEQSEDRITIIPL